MSAQASYLPQTADNPEYLTAEKPLLRETQRWQRNEASVWKFARNPSKRRVSNDCCEKTSNIPCAVSYATTAYDICSYWHTIASTRSATH